MAMIKKNDLPEFTGRIIDLFEDFLEEKGIQIENDEREGDEGEAIIYGSDYGILQEGIEGILNAWGLMSTEEKTNTEITYLYRDADNYKIFNCQVVKGLLTEEEIREVISTLQDGEYFIPSQVGLPENRFSGTEADHPYFELTLSGFQPTDKKPTIRLTAKWLLENFRKTGGKWKGMDEIG